MFVDASGRRQRRIRRLGRLLVIPAAGYVALLISSLLGGPSVSSPFLPQPPRPHTVSRAEPSPSTAPHGTTSHLPAARPAAAPARPSPTATTAAPTPTAGTTPSPTTGSPGRGHSTSVPGAAHRPVKSP